MSDHQGIKIENHDHDHNYSDRYGHGGGGTMAGWAILAFIAFIVVIWAVWSNHNRCSDQHLSTMRATDQVGYLAGRTQQELQDILYETRAIRTSQGAQFDYALANGLPSRSCSQPIYGKPCGVGGGGIYNGSPVNAPNTYAADYNNSVFA